MPSENTPSKREYPAVYERLVPIVIVLLAVIVAALLIFTILVGVGVLDL